MGFLGAMTLVGGSGGGGEGGGVGERGGVWLAPAARAA